MTSPIPLRERLQAAELVQVEDDFDPSMLFGRTNDEAADVALRVFRDWLRDQAADLRAEPFEIPGGLAGRATEIMVEQTAKYLEDVLVFAIDEELKRG